LVFAGGYFDPLNLASGDEERAFRLKTAEIKHGRLAMVAFFGFGVQVRCCEVAQLELCWAPARTAT
jgi:light-harvesting complex II chlorophyll a/b binding protein 4